MFEEHRVYESVNDRKELVQQKAKERRKSFCCLFLMFVVANGRVLGAYK